MRADESQFTMRMSFVCDALLRKMTPVTDVGAAFNLKKLIENEVSMDKCARMCEWLSWGDPLTKQFVRCDIVMRCDREPLRE